MNDFDFDNRFLSVDNFFTDSDIFVTFNVYENKFILKKDDSRYNCLRNRCAHRGMLLQENPIGKSKLSCKYHNWVYDNKGCLLNKTPFNDGSIKIDSFEASTIEEFIYIGNVEDNELKSCLEFLGVDMNCSVSHAECLTHRANWKWLVENVLETYHINSVHSDTFVDAGFKYTKNVKEVKFGKSSCLFMPKYKDEKGFYKHSFIWPNLFISNTSDFITFISIINPLSENQTDLHWYILPGKKTVSLPTVVKDKIINDAVLFTKKVLLEDKAIVELQQKGCGSHYHNGILTGIEKRLQWFWSNMNV